MPSRTTRVDVAAVLFDLDGTLVDSTAAVDRNWRAMAIQLGHDPQTVVGRFHGMPADLGLRTIEPELSEEQIIELHRQFLAGEIADTSDVVAAPGALDLLTALPADRWAVVTSCTLPLAEARLTAAGLPAPRELITAERTSRGKPAPDPFVFAAGRLGVPPTECLAIEDAPAGITAARAAGCDVLGVLTTHDVLDGPAVASLADVTISSYDGGVRITYSMIT